MIWRGMKKSSLSDLFPDNVTFLDEAKADFIGLDRTQQTLVVKAIAKVAKHPEPVSEGGYGKPLGNHAQTSLAGYLKIKLKRSGLRVVYRYVHTKHGMKIIIIDVRDEDHVYKEAVKRIQRSMD